MNWPQLWLLIALVIAALHLDAFMTFTLMVGCLVIAIVAMYEDGDLPSPLASDLDEKE